jgi:hypothetical protein
MCPSPAELDQAKAYQQAQLALIKNPEDKEAFSHTLPNNFCAYCHAFDQRGRRGGEGKGGSRQD